MLCRVAATADTSQATARCFTTGRLEVDAPPAACVLGTTYFYGDAGMLYAVHNVHTDAAVFETTGFDFGNALVRDVAPVSTYLVGVADVGTGARRRADAGAVAQSIHRKSDGGPYS